MDNRKEHIYSLAINVSKDFVYCTYVSILECLMTDDIVLEQASAHTRDRLLLSGETYSTSLPAEHHFLSLDKLSTSID